MVGNFLPSVQCTLKENQVGGISVLKPPSGPVVCLQFTELNTESGKGDLVFPEVPVLQMFPPVISSRP